MGRNILVGLGAFLLGLSLTLNVLAEEKKPTQSPQQNCDLHIEGMTCLYCAKKVEQAVADIVVSSKIEHQKGVGHFVYNSSAVSCQEIWERVNQTGFKASVTHAHSEGALD